MKKIVNVICYAVIAVLGYYLPIRHFRRTK